MAQRVKIIPAGYYPDEKGRMVYRAKQTIRLDMWGNRQQSQYLRSGGGGEASASAAGKGKRGLVYNPRGGGSYSKKVGIDPGYGRGGGGAEPVTRQGGRYGGGGSRGATGYSVGLGLGYDAQYGAGGQTGYGDTLAGGNSGGFRTVGADGRARSSVGAMIKQAGQGGDGGQLGVLRGSKRTAIGFAVQRVQALGGLSNNTGGSRGRSAMGRFMNAARGF